MRSVFHGILGLSALYHTAVAALPAPAHSQERVTALPKWSPESVDFLTDKLHPPPKNAPSKSSIRRPPENNSVTPLAPWIHSCASRGSSSFPIPRAINNHGPTGPTKVLLHLTDRGFIVFAPHNPYRGRDAFRVLQRKANPLGKTLFSIIVPQHSRILDWLETQPYIDPKQIGFYGLSYGGKSAMRIPALEPRYCLSICSADFNEWIRKNTTVDARYSYIFSGEYEIFEYDLGHTFNYAEMAALIAPRPFMVERGHHDSVAPDEWVAYEFAKVRGSMHN